MGIATIDASRYEKGKAALLRSLARLRDIEPDEAARAEQIEASLEGGFFTLAIMGQVKRGKTTIANALLGRELLPVAALPLTSVITLIRHGKKEKFSVEFLDGRKKEIGAGQIAGYITEERNPKNEKGVKSLLVEFPSRFLSQGVVLVDTPGIGSVYLHNTEITHQFLPEVDAALFVLSPDPPITEPECAFLEESAKFASKFFFVLTKSDYLDGQELAQVCAFSRKVIAERMGLKKEVALHCLSGKRALAAKRGGGSRALEQSGFPAFESALSDFAVRHKGKLILSASAGRTARLAQEILNQRLVEQSSMSTSDDELKFRLERFDAAMEKARTLKVELDEMLHLEQQRMIEALDDDLKDFVASACPKAAAKALEYAEKHKDCGNEEFNRAVDEFRSELVLKALGNLRDEQEQKIARDFSQRVRKYSARMDEIVKGVESAASDIFKVKIKSAPGAERLELESNFYFKLSREGQDIESPGLALALPRSMFRKGKINRIAHEVEEDFDRNAGRIRYDFLERMRKSADRFKWQLSDRIDAVAEGIRSASERAVQSREAGKKAAAARLAQVRKDITTLKQAVSACEKTRLEAGK